MKDVLGTWLPIFLLPTLTEDLALFIRLPTLTLHNWYHLFLQNTGFLPQLSRSGTIIDFKIQACLHPPKTITGPLKIKDSEQQNPISIRQSFTLMCLSLKHNHIFMEELLPCLKALMREKIRASQLADFNEAFNLVFLLRPWKFWL